jgi:hypothetical protein
MLIVRYPDGTRINHWLTVGLFLCAGLSGLALFHPSMFFFTALFGGGQWSRILHPFFGLLMVLCFIFLFFKMWRSACCCSCSRASSSGSPGSPACFRFPCAASPRWCMRSPPSS